MADHDLEVVETFCPSSTEIDFLTGKINEESRAQNISSDAYPFGIFLRRRERNNSGSGRDGNHSTTRLDPAASSSITETTQLDATTKNGNGQGKQKQVEAIVGGCNGSIVYGSIYIDQLWVDEKYRGKGIGKLLMEKVHYLGKSKNCAFATVGTMDFQGAQSFYERLGYKVEFERGGYDNGGKMIYLKKDF